MKETGRESPGQEADEGEAELQPAPVGEQHGHQRHRHLPDGEGDGHEVALREGGGGREPLLPSTTHMEGEVADPVEEGHLLPAARDLQHHGEGHDEAG